MVLDGGVPASRRAGLRTARLSASRQAARRRRGARRCNQVRAGLVEARVLPDVEISGSEWDKCVDDVAKKPLADIIREGSNIREAGKQAKNTHGDAASEERYQRALDRCAPQIGSLAWSYRPQRTVAAATTSRSRRIAQSSEHAADGQPGPQPAARHSVG